MKRPLSVALVLCFSLATSSFAAEKKRSPKKPSTLPPKSPMIVLPPPTDPAIKSGEAPKLITSEMSGKDLQFFTTVADAGRFLASLVELLKTRAESDQIKALGDALSATQDEENKQVARLAALKGWSVTTAPTPAQKAIGAELEKQTGANFDKAVMDKVVAASRESVSAYEVAAQSNDREIKTFADQLLPLAQEKLQLAERMTGAGKAAGKLFRTGTPPVKPVPSSSPKPIPPPITK